MTWDTQLADDEYIQWSTQPGGDLITHRHTTTGKRQHDYVISSRILREPLSEDTASIPAIAEYRIRHTPQLLPIGPPGIP
jgi:hypothetical protein